MTNTNLTDIDGVGDGKADQLRDAGFDTVGEIAFTTIDELTNAEGFGEGNAGEIIDNAVDALGPKIVEGEDGPEWADADADAENSEAPADIDDTADADAVDGDDVDDNLFENGSEDVPWSEEDLTELVGSDADSSRDGVYGLELETDAQILAHMIHVVLEEATSQHQSTNIPNRDTAYGLARKLMAVQVDSGELVDTTLVLTSSELSAFYRALTAGSADYAGRSGIPAMWAEFETIRSQVNEKRKESMAD